MIIGTLQDYCTAQERISMKKFKISKETKKLLWELILGVILWGLFIAILFICSK